MANIKLQQGSLIGLSESIYLYNESLDAAPPEGVDDDVPSWLTYEIANPNDEITFTDTAGDLSLSAYTHVATVSDVAVGDIYTISYRTKADAVKGSVIVGFITSDSATDISAPYCDVRLFDTANLASTTVCQFYVRAMDDILSRTNTEAWDVTLTDSAFDGTIPIDNNSVRIYMGDGVYSTDATTVYDIRITKKTAE